MILAAVISGHKRIASLVNKIYNNDYSCRIIISININKENGLIFNGTALLIDKTQISNLNKKCEIISIVELFLNLLFNKY